MPHGIFLHAAPKSSNNYSLLYRASTSSTPSRNILRCNHPLVLFSNFCTSTKSIRCNSYLLRTTAFLLLGKPPENSGTDYYARNQLLAWNHINNTQRTSPTVLAPNKLCSTIHRRSKGTNDSSGASSDLRSWCTSGNFCALTSQRTASIPLWKFQYFLMQITHPETLINNFTTENDFWLRITLTTLSATDQRCQHHIQGALPLKKNSEQNNATYGASSYHQWWCTSRDFRPFARSILIDLLCITILLLLSPNKLGMDIYLINQMTSAPLTSNDSTCDNTFILSFLKLFWKRYILHLFIHAYHIV